VDVAPEKVAKTTPPIFPELGALDLEFKPLDRRKLARIRELSKSKKIIIP
jgi:hypothetical protein